ncbi:MAG TPA: NAD(P)H-hydrate dehydratase [Blastocatellia bacterium]|nr:NAD(P)H-hydrate dehydratase [Blastocatellia bacterium]
MKILSAVQMREVDRATSARHGVPSLQLMENAATRTVEAIEEKFGDVSGNLVLVICGRGNNGGDGAAIARLLYDRGASVDAFLLGRIDQARGDAHANFERAKSLSEAAGGGLQFIEVESSDVLRKSAAKQGYDLVIDAIFGTGLTRAAADLFEEAIVFINEFADTSRVVSVDIPSGLASDSAELIGQAVSACLTVTFTAPKVATILPPACGQCGELIVADIGSPAELVESSGSHLNLIEEGGIRRWLQTSRRSSQANKGDVGKVLVVAGSRGKTGAACLVGEAALRAGCGLVTIAAPDSSQPIVASSAIRECMTEPLPETASGSVAREATDQVRTLAAERDVVAIGPGLGSTEASTREMVRAVVEMREGPMVADADALNALAPWDQTLRGSSGHPLILTPHPGEMSRLVSKSVAEVLRDRVEIARQFAASNGVVLVLKGSATLIAAPDGEVYVNSTGNEGMATGGSGDVLTGMIAGLLAQKLDDPLGATIAAVYLHGFAGDLAASRLGTRAMIASDITAHLGEALIEVGGEGERLVR